MQYGITNPVRTFAGALAFSAVLALVSGCSSDDAAVPAPLTYGGNTTPAQIDDGTTAEEVGTTAGEASIEAINANLGSESNSILFGVEINTDAAETAALVTEITKAAIDSLSSQNLPASIVFTADDLNTELGTSEFCGGSINIPDNLSAELNGSFTYNNLCYNDGTGDIFLNGTVNFSIDGNQLTISYSNFTITTSEGTQSFNATLVCDTQFASCTYQSTFVGADGETHQIDGFTVIENFGGGYDVTATFYHATHGEVTVSATGITYGDCGVLPDGGTITFSSSDGSSGTITFSSNPCSFSGTWDDGAGGAGSF